MLKSMLFGGPMKSSGSWVLKFNGNELNLRNIHLGENGILYVGGDVYGHTHNTKFIRSIFSTGIESTGRISWQNFFEDTDYSTSKQSEKGCVTTTGSDVIVGGQQIVGSSAKGIQLCLYSEYGDALKIKGIGNNKGIAGPISGITSGGDYVYVFGQNIVAKLTKDLNKAVWIKYFTNINSIIKGVACNPDSGNIYFYMDGSNLYSYVCSLSSTGTTRWLKKADETDKKVTGICVNSEGVYVCGIEEYARDKHGTIIKYTESGSVVWRKAFSLRGNTNLCGISTDIAGNLYAIGNDEDLRYFIKLSSSGDVLLCIKININIGELRSIQIDAEGNIYLCSSIYIVKLTKNDIESITVESPLSIGPLTFEKNSIGVTFSSFDQTNLSANLDNTTQYTLISSTFTSRKANLDSILYKG